MNQYWRCAVPSLPPMISNPGASVIDANLTAPFVAATQVAARMVRRGGGSIVNFSSIASEGNAGQAAYGAAKAGIEGLTRTMAIELGPLGVRVNALALGFIDVATTRNAVADERLRGLRAENFDGPSRSRGRCHQRDRIPRGQYIRQRHDREAGWRLTSLMPGLWNAFAANGRGRFYCACADFQRRYLFVR